jgi:Beta-lactamase superfamily domain
MSAFITTFLGHQGWMLRSGRSCVLVDPLLWEEFGAVHALEYSVHPPRVFAPENFPAVDAVVLSHEHDDHFDIPSLARLDRRIPVFVSMHSSTAARQIIHEMGFAVRPLVPGVPITIGELQIIPFTGDHFSVNCADEWDTLPYLVRDLHGAGSFFSTVDVALVPAHVRWAKAYAPRPGLVTWSNNALDWSHMADQVAEDVGTEQCWRSMAAGHRLISAEWGKPGAMLMCAGGFAFGGDQAWFNERVFWVDTEQVCARLASTYMDERFCSTLPGQTFWMEGNRLTKIDESTSFLETQPRERWPVRGRRVPAHVPDYAPATGRRSLNDGDDALLREGLDRLAVGLVGGFLFRSLHSILAVEAQGRKPTFALVLRHGSEGSTAVFEYDPSACAFVPVVCANPRDTYLAGWECWAADLIAVLRRELGPIALMFGRARLWNHLPHRFHFDLQEALARVSHPLSSPAGYLSMYRRMWAKSRSIVPAIRAASEAHGGATP